nr:MAG: hypothetical protein [Apis mellifera filamentous virus]
MISKVISKAISKAINKFTIFNLINRMVYGIFNIVLIKLNKMFNRHRNRVVTKLPNREPF